MSSTSGEPPESKDDAANPSSKKRKSGCKKAPTQFPTYPDDAGLDHPCRLSGMAPMVPIGLDQSTPTEPVTATKPKVALKSETSWRPWPTAKTTPKNLNLPDWYVRPKYRTVTIYKTWVWHECAFEPGRSMKVKVF